ncbi:hypothetical protein DSUL_100030 [Desulfovibrionales bacterium]
MEKILLRLARQLNAYDEASLMSLWDKYAAIVRDFEPTQHWETATLVLSFIQGLRWKNQLFNYNWSTVVNSNRLLLTLVEDDRVCLPDDIKLPLETLPSVLQSCKKKSNVLAFRQVVLPAKIVDAQDEEDGPS